MTTTLAAIARDAGVTARVHARAIDRDSETGVHPDEPVVLASVFKVPILVALLRRAEAGEIDLGERVRVGPEHRTPGPTGLSVMSDEVELSLRDLALSMITVSDNTATDLILARVGIDAVNRTLNELGLVQTRLVTDCRGILDGLAQELGAPSAEELSEHLGAMDGSTAEGILAAAALDPSRTNASTPRETARLLQLVWRNEAGPVPACEEARRILALQVWPHRLRSGFPDEVQVSGKTGTLPYQRNEAGVVQYPDGDRYAVAVFLRATTPDLTAPDADRTIGTLARAAVESLRERR